jgi:hypothetical protein
LAVVTQVFPPGVFTTPLPFFVLASPPLLVWVVVTPFPFFCASHAFPVLELLPPAASPLSQTVRPLGVLVHSANAVEEKTRIAAAQVSTLNILTHVIGGYLQGLRYRLVVIDPRWAEARDFRSAAHEAIPLASGLLHNLQFAAR